MKNKDTAEFFEALKLLEKEKGIPMDYLTEKISTAIAVAVKKDSGGSDENVFVEMDPASGSLTMGLRKTVVEELTNPETEMLPDEALRYSKTAKVGDIVTIELEPKQFGRIKVLGTLRGESYRMLLSGSFCSRWICEPSFLNP